LGRSHWRVTPQDACHWTSASFEPTAQGESGIDVAIAFAAPFIGERRP
jgi:hypothetical protein